MLTSHTRPEAAHGFDSSGFRHDRAATTRRIACDIGSRPRFAGAGRSARVQGPGEDRPEPPFAICTTNDGIAPTAVVHRGPNLSWTRPDEFFAAAPLLVRSVHRAATFIDAALNYICSHAGVGRRQVGRSCGISLRSSRSRCGQRTGKHIWRQR